MITERGAVTDLLRVERARRESDEPASCPVDLINQEGNPRDPSDHEPEVAVDEWVPPHVGDAHRHQAEDRAEEEPRRRRPGSLEGPDRRALHATATTEHCYS